MRICVAGGKTKADFLIDFFIKKGHELVVINEDEKFSEFLAQKHDIPIYFSDPTLIESLQEAEIEEFDVLVAMAHRDFDNLKICQMAQKLNVKKVVAVLNDPLNVETFKALGIHNTISATYVTCRFIEQVSVFNNITNNLSLEDENVAISNVIIENDSPLLNKTLMEIRMPGKMIIGCILRKSGLVIPKGDTTIKLGDKLLLISSKEKQGDAVKFITGN